MTREFDYRAGVIKVHFNVILCITETVFMYPIEEMGRQSKKKIAPTYKSQRFYKTGFLSFERNAFANSQRSLYSD